MVCFEELTPKLPTDHGAVTEYLSALSEKHPKEIRFFYIGRTFRGRSIPAASFGDGDDVFLYVGAHHGMEHLTSSVLLAFTGDFCVSLDKNEKDYGTSLRELLRGRTLVVVPMLNCDGVELQIHGVEKGDPLRQRLISMNGMSEDFSHWQANARGVDLNHNYDAGFYEYKEIERSLGIAGGAPTKYSGLYPESEPEVSSLCGFIRFHRVKGILTLHTQGEVIYPGASSPEDAEFAAKATGYEVSTPDGTALYGGLTDWASSKLGIVSLTVECGKGKNPLPDAIFPSLYNRLRKLLFTFPKTSGKASVSPP